MASHQGAAAGPCLLQTLWCPSWIKEGPGTVSPVVPCSTASPAFPAVTCPAVWELTLGMLRPGRLGLQGRRLLPGSAVGPVTCCHPAATAHGQLQVLTGSQGHLYFLRGTAWCAHADWLLAQTSRGHWRLLPRATPSLPLVGFMIVGGSLHTSVPWGLTHSYVRTPAAPALCIDEYRCSRENLY